MTEVIFLKKGEFAPICTKYNGLFHSTKELTLKYRYPEYFYYGERDGKAYVEVRSIPNQIVISN